MNQAIFDQLMQLSEAERLELADELYASVTGAEDAFELTPEEMAEIDRRVEEHERDPSSAIPWEVVKERLYSRYK